MRRFLLASLLASLALSGAAYAHSGHGDPAPWAACEGAARGQTCEFSPHTGGLHRGTCQTFGGRPVCVRNQPVVPGRVQRLAEPARSPSLQTVVLFGFALLISTMAIQLRQLSRRV